jgi:hypothetical protein
MACRFRMLRHRLKCERSVPPGNREKNSRPLRVSTVGGPGPLSESRLQSRRYITPRRSPRVAGPEQRVSMASCNSGPRAAAARAHVGRQGLVDLGLGDGRRERRLVRQEGPLHLPRKQPYHNLLADSEGSGPLHLPRPLSTGLSAIPHASERTGRRVPGRAVSGPTACATLAAHPAHRRSSAPRPRGASPA